jgi:hypothetical protein
MPSFVESREGRRQFKIEFRKWQKGREAIQAEKAKAKRFEERRLSFEEREKLSLEELEERRQQAIEEEKIGMQYEVEALRKESEAKVVDAINCAHELQMSIQEEAKLVVKNLGIHNRPDSSKAAAAAGQSYTAHPGQQVDLETMEAAMTLVKMKQGLIPGSAKPN